MPEVVVYSKSMCIQCDATKRDLTKKGIEFTEINLEENPDALEKVRALGYQQAPVVVFGEYTWSGFRPDNVKKLLKELV